MKIDYTQQNSKGKLWKERDEIVNHVEGEYSKLEQKWLEDYERLVGKDDLKEIGEKNQNLTVVPNGISKKLTLS